jgi:hypothetical protein
MNKKRVASLNSKTPSLRLFGPPPLLEGEDAAVYEELAARVFSAVQPTDFIEEIWARDLADVSWNLLRLRRVQAAFLSAQVSDAASDAANTEATSLAEAEAELMEGSEKEEMVRFLKDDSLSWEKLVAQNPRANEKFQGLWASAMSNLDMDAIQAKVMLREFDKIEQIENLIAITERRFDAIIREMDRHRVLRVHFVEAEKPKMIEQKMPNKKVA